MTIDDLSSAPSSIKWLQHLESPKSAPDDLDRMNFVSSLAEALIRLPEDQSVVTAVYGPWGSGKTWLLEQLVKQLDQDDRMTTCRFSPWELKSHDQILAEFFTAVSGKIRAQDEDGDIMPYWELFEQLTMIGSLGATGVISALSLTGILSGPDLTAAAASGPLLGSIASLFGKTKDGAKSRMARKSAPSLAESKEQISGILKEKLRRPILIVIDDLDRLTHTEIQMMIRLLNTTANLPKLHYLIFGDRRQIASALDPVCGNQGDRYLEKIVQNSFQVPEPGETQIRARLWEGFRRIIENKTSPPDQFKSRFAEFWGAFLKYRISNFRDCHRLLRTFAFHVGALTREGSLEVDPLDLLGIDFLRLFDTGLYHAIASLRPNENLYPERTSVQKKDDSPAILELIRSSTSGDRMACSVLFQLFPNLYRYVENFTDEHFKKQHPPTTGNRGTALSIRYPKRTDSYFLLEINDAGLPEHIIRAFFASLDEEARLLDSIRKIAANQWIPEFLWRIRTFTEPWMRGMAASAILRALAEVSNEVAAQMSDDDILDTGFERLDETIDQLMKELAHAGMSMEILPSITDSADIALPLLLLAKVRRKNGCAFYDKASGASNLPAIPKSEIEILCDDILPKATEQFISGRFKATGIWLQHLADAIGAKRLESILRNEKTDLQKVWRIIYYFSAQLMNPLGSWPNQIGSIPTEEVLRTHLARFASLGFWKEFLARDEVTSGTLPDSDWLLPHLTSMMASAKKRGKNPNLREHIEEGQIERRGSS